VFIAETGMRKTVADATGVPAELVTVPVNEFPRFVCAPGVARTIGRAARMRASKDRLKHNHLPALANFIPPPIL
jgi:hypothetical protein